MKKIKKLQGKLKNVKNKDQPPERSPSPYIPEDFCLAYNEDDDSIYLPPSDWAGTMTPNCERSPPANSSNQEAALPQVADLSPQPGPSSACAAPTVPVPAAEQDLDDSILSLLGDAPKPETVFGNNIHKDVATRWQEILAKGLPKETKEKLVSEYLIPANCVLLVPPILNPEAKAALPDALVKRDFSLLNKQKGIAAALAALAQVTDMLISNEFSREKLLKPLSDASRLLCDSHHIETKTRRSFVISSINYNLKGALIEASRDKFLFGENLTEKLNAAKTIQKSGDTLKNQQRPQTGKNNVNNKDKPKGRLNTRALHPRQTTARFDAGQNRSAAYRAPPAARTHPPPPRRTRSPQPPPPPPPRTQQHQHYRR
ncbi:uncharacterized protein LOC135072215 [Ostrinia nubilalis]|uniref:uncharacterized protein LOC135072215 n=1 Tax=Ostrinia nubilalis TaxID=29057 RepID=UPI00308228E7